MNTTFNVNKFFYYDELSTEAQAQARINILVPEYEARKREIKEALSAWCTNSNKAINDPYHIRRLFNGGAALRKVKQFGNDYLIRFIRDNRTIFTDKGDYVYYIKECVELVSQGSNIKLNSDNVKQLAIQAYIDVNHRGPDFHDNLYRTWHKIKFRMITNQEGKPL